MLGDVFMPVGSEHAATNKTSSAEICLMLPRMFMNSCVRKR
jgi:hypothetical protein